MKYKIILVFILLVGVRTATAQDTTNGTSTEPKGQDGKEIETAPALPGENTTEYWVVRSQAMTEFIPFLSKKRTEIKKKRLLLADYLLKIGKANDFADRNMPVTYDSKIYFDILQIGAGFKEMNVEYPKERPSWDALVQIAMQYITFEGYLPTDVEEGSEAEQYIAICKKKEEYGKKVRKDIRSILDQSAKMWVYLGQIGKLDEFKVYTVDLVLKQKAAKTKERAVRVEQHRQEVSARAAEKKQREFDDAQSRARYKSSQRGRSYESRQDRLRYRQSRLDERFTNSRAYYY